MYKFLFTDRLVQSNLTATRDNNESMKILDVRLTKDKGIARLSFSILVDSPLYVFIREMITEVAVVNERTNETVFEGRVFDSTVDWNANTVIAEYECEELTGYLHDSAMTEYNYKGKPSGLLKWIIERNNSQLEPHKQWAVGVCEIDTYRTYVEEGITEGVNKTLLVGDTATIKPTATYIYDWNGNQLRMADYAKGVAHTVTDTRILNDVTQYLLSRTWSNGVTSIEGFVNEGDIIETRTVRTVPVTTTEPTQSINTTSIVRIKSTATHYYKTAKGEGQKSIPDFAKARTYTIRHHSEKYNRYAIYYRGILTAWIDEDFVIISKSNITGEIERSDSSYVDAPRTIDVKVSYTETAYDAINNHLLEPYDAEIEWTRVEGVPTLNIRNRIMRETNNVIRPSLNLINMNLSTSPDIVTVVIPKGTVKSEEVEA